MLNLKLARLPVLVVLLAAALVSACKNTESEEEEEEKGGFTLSYNANSMAGIIVPASVKRIAQGDRIPVQAFTGVPAAHYTFYLWNTSSDGRGEWFEPESTIVITEDVTLFAIYDGDGSIQAAPKLIDSPEGIIAAFNAHNQSGNVSGFYKQVRDIDFTGKGWVPLCADAFKGLYDGAGHTISGININVQNATNGGKYGFFNRVASNTGCGIKNLVVKGNINVRGESVYVGLLAGSLEAGFIENCAAIGTVTVNGNSCEAGLIAGYSGGNIKFIKNSYAVGTVTMQGVSGHGFAGGLVGTNSTYITDCFSIVNVIGGTHSGGIVGYIQYHNYPPEAVTAANLASLGTTVSVVACTDGYGSPGAGSLFGCMLCTDGGSHNINPAPLFYNAAMSVTPTPTNEYGAASVALSATQVYVSDTNNWWAQNMHLAFGTSETAPWQWDAQNKRPKLWFEK